ncbi:MAG TPA: YhcN/YlaJ family sporulation lipoprotein [Desulfobacteria bacterium]|nr:YhcN/YlaJ family sporulation lipoprotein [Desulfobacteria bacterium]
MFKKISAVILTVMFFSTLALGCQAAKKPDNPNRVPPRNERNVGDADDKLDRRAENLAKEANKVKGVRKAAVVISGSMAYVGIDLQPNFKGKTTESVKEAVADRVENADKKITRAYVTSDVGLVTRIRRVADGIANGRPISSFADEIREIGARIVPDSSRE